MARKELPEVNASSLADIAFLLLTFFLIATSMDKQEGIQRQLPDLNKKPDEIKIKVEQQNAIEFVANAYGQILYKEDPTDIRQINVKEVKNLVMEHVDNGGGVDGEGNQCTWCMGGPDNTRSADLSNHPKLAIISVKFDKGTSWADYMALQGEIEAAYHDLKANYVQRTYKKDWDMVVADPTKPEDTGDNAIIADADSKYPKIIAEPAPSDASN